MPALYHVNICGYAAAYFCRRALFVVNGHRHNAFYYNTKLLLRCLPFIAPTSKVFTGGYLLSPVSRRRLIINGIPDYIEEAPLGMLGSPYFRQHAAAMLQHRSSSAVETMNTTAPHAIIVSQVRTVYSMNEAWPRISYIQCRYTLLKLKTGHVASAHTLGNCRRRSGWGRLLISEELSLALARCWRYSAPRHADCLFI